MKNKKILIICIIIAVLLIVAVVGALLYIQNNKKNEEEYNKASERYDKLVNVSEKINANIDKKVSEAKDFLDTDIDVGENNANIDDLRYTISKLEGYKIEIESKSKKLNELKAANDKIENKLKEIDPELIEYYIVNGGNIIEETNINIGYDTELNLAILDIDTLIEKVNEDVKAEANRKAEEEEKTLISKMLSGDFTYAVGTYSEVMYGTGGTLTIKADGTVIMNNAGESTSYKITSVKKQNNGSYFGVTSKVLNYADEYVGDAGFEIYPVGVKSNFGNVNKIRITRIGGFSVDGGFQKN